MNSKLYTAQASNDKPVKYTCRYYGFHCGRDSATAGLVTVKNGKGTVIHEMHIGAGQNEAYNIPGDGLQALDGLDVSTPVAAGTERIQVFWE